jgi:hypothetical protein
MPRRARFIATAFLRLSRRHAAAAALASAAIAVPAAAESAAPSLVVAVFAKPADRPALRTALAKQQAGRLSAWRRQGLISGYRLLFTRYADAAVWDGLELLTFRDEAALARWNEIERQGAGGLPPDALRLVSQVVTTPGDEIRRAGGPVEAPAPAILAVPYTSLVSEGEYLKYLDGYTLPQFDGWRAAGVLDGYQVVASRYPADRPWSALILLRYRDDASLARRDEVKDKVRGQLAQQPAWKAISDSKKEVRVEKAAAVADQLAAEGEGQ